jgi:1-acyl-sn-glycerol-3-phosphate acyltransferase
MTDTTNSQAPRSAAPCRNRLVDAILQFLALQGQSDLEEIRADLEREIDRFGPAALSALEERMAADDGWDYHDPDPIARSVHHLLSDWFLDRDSRLDGAHHLAPVAGAPVVVCANHLSYSDGNVIEVLLHRFGGGELAGRLTALAGPKVFTSRQRRFSSLCFGTIKVPQSAGVASEEAVQRARDVARTARHSIAVAHDRLRAGDALILFGEGTRSRTASMQPLLPGVARYLEVPGTWVLPAGLTGSESLFSVRTSALRRARVTMHAGQPMRAEALFAAARGDRRTVVDAIGLAISGRLPPAYRGVYSVPGDFAGARAVLDELSPRR